jgi:hypothetical protein
MLDLVCWTLCLTALMAIACDVTKNLVVLINPIFYCNGTYSSKGSIDFRGLNGSRSRLQIATRYERVIHFSINVSVFVFYSFVRCP